ncbi:MAG: ribbon-helix-helix domain-containing protein [Jiangellaceae bacterium]
MKISVSLPESDVAFLDEYAGRHDVDSRSAVVQEAVALLRESQLEVAYTQAWQEWDHSADAARWEGTVGDGLGDAPR